MIKKLIRLATEKLEGFAVTKKSTKKEKEKSVQTCIRSCTTKVKDLG